MRNIQIGQGAANGNIGGFANHWYWSSSLYNDNNNLAWYTHFGFGFTDFDVITAHHRVRPIRAF